MAMHRQIDVELEALRAQIIRMAEKVEEAITDAVEGLLQRDAKRFDHVVELETQINRLHIEVDSSCLRLLATQSPVAHNLRYIVAIMKINSDLERMGDQAVNISANGRFYLNEPEEPVRKNISKMAGEVRTMVHEALEAFVEQHITLATGVLLRDEIVDNLKDQIFRELIPFMEKDSKTIQRSLDLILISRNLERIADHATNIAEDVIFACTGEDIRHSVRTTINGQGGESGDKG